MRIDRTESSRVMELLRKADRLGGGVTLNTLDAALLVRMVEEARGAYVEAAKLNMELVSLLSALTDKCAKAFSRPEAEEKLESVEVKPCPFCGEAPYVYDEGLGSQAVCTNALCATVDSSSPIPIADWNDRPAESDLRDRLAFWKMQAERYLEKLQMIERGEIACWNWIAMSEREPRYLQEVFVLGRDGEAYSAKYQGRGKIWIGLQEDYPYDYVKCWLPVPRDPEGS